MPAHVEATTWMLNIGEQQSQILQLSPYSACCSRLSNKNQMLQLWLWTDVHVAGTGSGLLTKRLRSPGFRSPNPSDPTSAPLPISRRSKAKAVAQVKRKRLEPVSEPDAELSDSPPPG